MEAPISAELMVGVGAIAVAVLAVYLFVRATRGGEKGKKEIEESGVEKGPMVEVAKPLPPSGERYQAPVTSRYVQPGQVEKARSEIRVLTLRRELLSMALKRLFEAEDLGEITREERVRISKGYEDEMKRVAEEIKRSELILTLHELENIRDEIVKKFEATLNNTQMRIDAILKELNIEELKAQPEAQPEAEKKRRKVKEEGKEEPKEEAKEGEAEKPKAPKRSEVDEKLEQLRREVLKELEELEKLEIEV
ncbi:MAG: hypothetical protein QXD04_02170 [Candidatus Bathyarchaeia archaeon]